MPRTPLELAAAVVPSASRRRGWLETAARRRAAARSTEAEAAGRARGRLRRHRVPARARAAERSSTALPATGGRRATTSAVIGVLSTAAAGSTARALLHHAVEAGDVRGRCLAVGPGAGRAAARRRARTGRRSRTSRRVAAATPDELRAGWAREPARRPSARELLQRAPVPRGGLAAGRRGPRVLSGAGRSRAGRGNSMRSRAAVPPEPRTAGTVEAQVGRLTTGRRDPAGAVSGRAYELANDLCGSGRVARPSRTPTAVTSGRERGTARARRKSEGRRGFDECSGHQLWAVIASPARRSGRCRRGSRARRSEDRPRRTGSTSRPPARLSLISAWPRLSCAASGADGHALGGGRSGVLRVSTAYSLRVASCSRCAAA